jgi:hypothetical protein
MNFLGWIVLFIGIVFWYVGRFIKHVAIFIFSAVWWLLCAPFRLIWWAFGDGFVAVQRQWYRDKSVFFAKLLCTILLLFFLFKAITMPFAVK